MNKFEKIKQKYNLWEYYHSLPSLNFSNLTQEDRFLLKNFGIYNSPQQPQKFSIRLRIPAGRIEKEKFLFLLELRERYNLILLPTTRGQLELHNLSSGNVLEVFFLLRKRGIDSFATLVDNFRGIITDPLDGLKEHFVEVYPIILELEEVVKKFLGKLPRKFNTAIIGVKATPHNFKTNDALFIISRKEEELGFNLYLGGKNLALAQDANLFVPLKLVKPFLEAIGKAYLTFSCRKSRSKIRLFHHIERVGIEKFRQQIQYFCPFPVLPKGEELLKEERIKSIYHTPKGVVYRVPFNKLFYSLIQDSQEIRLGVDQHLYLLNPKTPPAVSKPSYILSCVGSKFCTFSLFDTKKEATNLPTERLAELNVTVGYSGCLKGCGRHFVSDIGLVGIRTNSFGKVERGVRFYLTTNEGAKLIFWAVPLRKLNQLIELVLDLYEESDFKSFKEFSNELIKTKKDVGVFLLQKLLQEETVKEKEALEKRAFV
ncbi:MAG: hypothetical protein GXO61_05735 [Epsilonproteobacteria bacterium]|nr:hypothetical protein [Campylobacterota bacterium]